MSRDDGPNKFKDQAEGDHEMSVPLLTVDVIEIN